MRGEKSTGKLHHLSVLPDPEELILCTIRSSPMSTCRRSPASILNCFTLNPFPSKEEQACIFNPLPCEEAKWVGHVRKQEATITTQTPIGRAAGRTWPL